MIGKLKLKTCIATVVIIFELSIINGVWCLYPKESPSREIKLLDGIWNFCICRQDDQDQGFRENWYKKSLSEVTDVIPMPVPSSFNDITQNKTIRDYLGWAWYDTEFYVPKRWSENTTVILRFGGAHYNTVVFLNGFYVVNHTGGHLPFGSNVTGYLNFNAKNRLTIALNNTLSPTTIPQGAKSFKSPEDGPYPPGFYTQTTNFDFFNYAGIHRSVVLSATPTYYIEDILIVTNILDTQGKVEYVIDTNPPKAAQSCEVVILDKKDKVVGKQIGCSGMLVVKNVTLWWPYTMHDNPGYQYTLQAVASFKLPSGEIITDIYPQKFGFRSIVIKRNSFLVNGKPFYFMGFGKHEDSNIRGKGLDIPLLIKDFNLIKWVGANSFRTSHYPYSEELMDQADEQGVVVIDECPAVGLTEFTDELLNLHMTFLDELIKRDKNRPSVFAWSVANEPESTKAQSDSYFRKITQNVRCMDPSRPVTAALNQNHTLDKAGKYLDFIMYNHYYSWYSDTGSTETIIPLLINDIMEAYSVYKKPIMMSEYGADTVAGLHTDPSFIFTEDYQSEVLAQHHIAFDILKQKGFFIGEHIWNFADFLTLQQLTRVVGNKKGIFTRERQPKASARILRCRYHKLAQRQLDGLAYCPAVSLSQINSCTSV